MLTLTAAKMTQAAGSLHELDVDLWLTLQYLTRPQAELILF